MFDILIKNGLVIDGTGALGFKGTVGIKDGLIANICNAATDHVDEREASQILDANGKVVCPGFIDIHSHGDFTLLQRPFSEDKVWQGVTTQTIGHCGFSAAPVSKEWEDLNASEMLGGIVALQAEWKTFSDYLSVLARQTLGTNVAAFVGYGPIRMAVMGVSGKEPSKNELAFMCNVLEEAMDAGAFGFTTGLAYPPQCQATTEELTTLCKVVARYGGLYATHVRDNTYDVGSGVREAIEIGKVSGVRVHIAHLQIRPNPRHNLKVVLNLMEQARDAGVEVTCDQYPYLAGQGPLTPLFPAWALAGGVEAIKGRLQDVHVRERIKTYMGDVVEQYFKWGDIVLWSIKNEALKGRSILTLANLWEKDPRDVAMDLLIDYGTSVSALYFGKTEEDLRAAAIWPYAMVGTDGVFNEEVVYNHPRTFGTFPRMIRKYVREEKVFSIEEVIRRMTSLTAQTLGLSNRGVLAEGKNADILIFDPETILDTPTYELPVQRSRGIDFVVVNGKIVKAQSQDNRISAGKVLQHFAGPANSGTEER